MGTNLIQVLYVGDKLSTDHFYMQRVKCDNIKPWILADDTRSFCLRFCFTDTLFHRGHRSGRLGTVLCKEIYSLAILLHCIVLLPNNKLCCLKLGTSIFVQFNIIYLNFPSVEHLFKISSYVIFVC
jgi:hypothetical protein